MLAPTMTIIEDSPTFSLPVSEAYMIGDIEVSSLQGAMKVRE